MNSDKILLGKSAEDRAADFLKRRGYRIIQRNVRLKFGEIDCVAREGDTLCFIEVKARTSDDFGSALESINSFKQRKLSKLALAYLKKYYHSVDIKSRFDVVAVTPNEQGDDEIEVIKNAFDFCG